MTIRKKMNSNKIIQDSDEFEKFDDRIGQQRMIEEKSKINQTHQ